MREKTEKQLFIGSAMTLLAAFLWGISGVCGKFMFDHKGANAQWMISIRLTLAGFLLILFTYFRTKENPFVVWKKKKDVLVLILFGIFGMGCCQLMYYTTVELSNAGTATVLQYTSPVMLLVILALKNKKLPSTLELCAIAPAVFGTFLLATHGNIGQLAVSGLALFTGIGSAATMCICILLPAKLMEKYGSYYITGWGMFIGGAVLSAFVRPWNYDQVIWDGQTVAGLTFIILCGTVIAFGIYMEGVTIVGPSKANLFASGEPLTATIATAVLMHVKFDLAEIIGFICIIGAVTMISLTNTKNK